MVTDGENHGKKNVCSKFVLLNVFSIIPSELRNSLNRQTNKQTSTNKL